MCFGERTTFVCPMCENKSWETKWYNFNADADECALGQPLGACADPYMAYHQENKYCATCLIRMHEASSPSPDPETFHPEDREHEHPTLLHYEESEHQTLQTTGQLTMPMRVSRALEAHAPHGTTLLQAVVPEHALMQEITNIVSSRGSRTLDPVRIVDPSITETPRNPEDGLYATNGADENTPVPPSTATPTNEADAANGEGENTIDPPVTDPPATPARPITPSRIPGYVFQGPVPQTALNDTPLPSYDQAVSHGQAPVYDHEDPDDMPINLRTLTRVARYAHGMDQAFDYILSGRLEEFHRKASRATEPNPRIAELVSIVNRLVEAWNYLFEEAKRRDEVLFEYSTTSATEWQTYNWIAEITRNPSNSVQSHSRRFSEWLYLLETELSSAISSNSVTFPIRRSINLAFEQQEVREQMRMQGDMWAGSADAWVTPTENDERIYFENMTRTRWFPAYYEVDDGDDENYTEENYVAVRSYAGRWVDVPDEFGVEDPSESYFAGDMMDVD